MHFKELGSNTEWQIAGGARFPLPSPDARAALIHGGYLEELAYVVPAGVMQQVGQPEEVYRRPANAFVAGFIGSLPMNFCL